MSISRTVEFAPLALKIRTQSSVVSIAESLGFSSGIPKSLTLNEQLYSRASSIYFASNSTLSDKRDKRVDCCEINCFVSLQLPLPNHMYFETDFKVFKMYFQYLNTIFLYFNPI